MTPPGHGLHVLMTTDTVGGVWTYAATLARELCRGGHRVTLVTLGPEPRAGQLQALHGIDGLNLEITELALEWMEPEGRNMSCTHARLAAIEQRFKPDVVHLNNYREACAEWSAPTLVVAHSCVRSWWLACRGCEPSESRWENYVDNVEAALASASRWAAPTTAFRDTIRSLYRPPTSGLVICNGIDVTPQYTAKQPFVLAAGRVWDEAKNLHVLADVAPHLGWPIRVAGATHAPDGSPTVTLPSANNLEFLGQLHHDALLARMQNAAVFCAPALYEPFGLTTLEAAANGCALVLSDLREFRELWNEAALFVDPRNARAIRAALRRVCSDASLRRQLQHAARRRAGRFSASNMADGYRDIYRQLTSIAIHERAPSASPRVEALA